MSQAVYNAWNNPGPVAGFHRSRQAQLHRDMPVLARALEQMPNPHASLNEEARLRKIISDAPHDRDNCRLYDVIGHRSVQLPESACNCWKSRA